MTHYIVGDFPLSLTFGKQPEVDTAHSMQTWCVATRRKGEGPSLTSTPVLMSRPPTSPVVVDQLFGNG